jgi:hypothetical protein
LEKQKRKKKLKVSLDNADFAPFHAHNADNDKLRPEETWDC